MKLYREKIKNETKEEFGTEKRLIASEHAEEVEDLKRQMREDIETLSVEHNKKLKVYSDYFGYTSLKMIVFLTYLGS